MHASHSICVFKLSNSPLCISPPEAWCCPDYSGRCGADPSGCRCQTARCLAVLRAPVWRVEVRSGTVIGSGLCSRLIRRQRGYRLPVVWMGSGQRAPVSAVGPLPR